MERFNLCSEKWIPVVAKGRVSLFDIFSDFTLKEIAGNAIQKLSLMKLLFAIAQRATPVANTKEWKQLKKEGMAEKCYSYLENHYDDFYLYGEHPFLQMPKLRELDVPIKEIFYDFQPDLASENNTLMRESEAKRILTDAEKAVFVLSLMNYAPAGKRITSGVSLTDDFKTGKSAKAGPSLGGFVGYLSSFLLGRTILETVYLNIFTDDLLDVMSIDHDSSILPPWEQMPEGENTDSARKLKKSLYSWYVAVSRFVLLEPAGIRYVEGLQYQSKIDDGYYEPYIMINNDTKKALYVDVAKKPWRQLPALLEATFKASSNSFKCDAVTLLIQRAREEVDVFGIWSGGLKVRSNSGDQSVKQDDDYVESSVFFDSVLFDEPYYEALQKEFKTIEKFANQLKYAVEHYYEDMGMKSNSIISRAVADYWFNCDALSAKIIGLCEDEIAIANINNDVWSYLLTVYDNYCPAESASQTIAWAKNRPQRKKEETENG